MFGHIIFTYLNDLHQKKKKEKLNHSVSCLAVNGTQTHQNPPKREAKMKRE